MAQIIVSSFFTKSTKHLNKSENERLQKLINKILGNPELGKPLKYFMGERVVRLKPFRLVYAYSKEEDILFLLRFEHRKDVYK